MNNKAILGISLGAVFAIGMMMTPAFAGFVGGDLTSALLKDHAAGNNPAKNPAHYELIVNATGNYTDYAMYQEAFNDVNATGFGLINSTGYVWAFTSHSLDDCLFGCGDYFPHGHEGQLINATGNGSTGNCPNADAELINVSDLGEAKVKVADGEFYSIIELDDIPADAKLNLEAEICDVDEVADVANMTSFTIKLNATANNALCVHVDESRSLDTVEGADGPDQRDNEKPKGKNKNWPTRVGGFNSTGTESDFCPTG
jgi:hypothetical protein